MEKIEKKEIRIEDRPQASRVTLVSPNVNREAGARHRQVIDWDFIRLALIAAFAVLVLSYVSPLIPKIWEKSIAPKTSLINDQMPSTGHPFHTTTPLNVLCCQGEYDTCPSNLCCTDECINEYLALHPQEAAQPHTILGKIMDRLQTWFPSLAWKTQKTTENLADKTSEMAGKTKQKAGEVVDKTKQKAGEVVDKTKQKAKEWTEQAKDTAHKAKDTLAGSKSKDWTDQAKDTADDLTNKAKDKGKEWASKAKGAAADLASGEGYLGDKAEQATDYLFDHVMQTADQLVDQAKGKAEDMKESFKGKAREYAEKAEGAKEMAKDLGGAAASSDSAEPLTEKLKEKAGEAKDFLLEKGEEILESGGNLYDKAKDYVKEKAEDTKDFLSEKGEQAKRTTQEAMDKTKQKVGEVVDKTKEKAQQMTDQGESLTDKAKDSLKQGADLLKDKTKDKAKDTFDSAKSYLFDENNEGESEMGWNYGRYPKIDVKVEVDVDEQ